MNYISREHVLAILDEHRYEQWAVVLRARVEALVSFPAPNPDWMHGQADMNVMGQTEDQFWDTIERPKF